MSSSGSDRRSAWADNRGDYIRIDGLLQRCRSRSAEPALDGRARWGTITLMQPDDKQRPGQTIAPGGAASPPPTPSPQTPPPTGPPEAPAAAVVAPEAGGAAAAETPQVAPAVQADDDPQAITWSASEFVAHDKSFGWYVALTAGAVALAALLYLITRDFVSVTVVIIAALLLGIYGSHKPRQQEYRLDPGGLTVGPKHSGYDEFRSFSVMKEGAFSSILFMPLKRFAVPTTIYYAPQDEDRIVGLLSDHLPLERRSHDVVDWLMHRIRF